MQDIPMKKCKIVNKLLTNRGPSIECNGHLSENAMYGTLIEYAWSS
jgi:hypothetical protein